MPEVSRFLGIVINMMKVKKVKYFQDYKLEILFSDGKTKIIDFEGWIFEDSKNKYLIPLSDLEFFKKVDLDEFQYTICWPNGADFCPDVLYAEGKEVKPTKRKKNPKSKKIKVPRARNKPKTLKSV